MDAIASPQTLMMAGTFLAVIGGAIFALLKREPQPDHQRDAITSNERPSKGASSSPDGRRTPPPVEERTPSPARPSAEETAAAAAVAAAEAKAKAEAEAEAERHRVEAEEAAAAEAKAKAEAEAEAERQRVAEEKAAAKAKAEAEEAERQRVAQEEAAAAAAKAKAEAEAEAERQRLAEEEAAAAAAAAAKAKAEAEAEAERQRIAEEEAAAAAAAAKAKAEAEAEAERQRIAEEEAAAAAAAAKAKAEAEAEAERQRIADEEAAAAAAAAKAKAEAEAEAERQRIAEEEAAAAKSPADTSDRQASGSSALSQAGGHADAFEANDDGTIIKKCNQGEWEFYRDLAEYPDLAPFVPRFVELLGSATDSPRVVLGNLTHGMERPCIMDIKMGTTSAAPNASPRKRASMLEKDAVSTTTTLGLRLTGLKTWNADAAEWIEHDKAFGKGLTIERVGPAIRQFFEEPHSDNSWKTGVLQQAIHQVREIQEFMSNASRLQFISSSLLFVFDAAAGTEARCSVKMIDFAHVFPLDEGSRDEGYLTGVKNLQEIFASFLEKPESTGVDDKEMTTTDDNTAQPDSGRETGNSDGMESGSGSEAGSVVSGESAVSNHEGQETKCPVLVVEYSFTARSEREVDLNEKDRVAVSEADSSGWWRGKNLNTGRTGWFPENYCKKTEEHVMVYVEPEEPDSDESSESDGESIFHVPDLTKEPEKSSLRIRPPGVSVDDPVSHNRRVQFDEEVEVLEMSEDDQWSSASSEDYGYGWNDDDGNDDDVDDDWDYDEYMRSISSIPGDDDQDEGSSSGASASSEDEASVQDEVATTDAADEDMSN